MPFILFSELYFQNKKRSNLKDKRIRHVNLNLYGVKIMVFPVWIDIEQNSLFYGFARVFICNRIFKSIANGTINKILQLRSQGHKTSYNYKHIFKCRDWVKWRITYPNGDIFFDLSEYLPFASVASIHFLKIKEKRKFSIWRSSTFKFYLWCGSLSARRPWISFSLR